ncbi:ATP-binding protein, partial [Streptococcus suis]|uniref:ATP-binding protein n=1 Tax=Streptococcus suis TaxID=1307 RepID=UPI00187748B6
KRVEKINDLINSYISLQYKYSGIYFYKLTDIIFDKETLNIYGESELKFQISENILSLFLEPLYASRNPFVVTIRELLQNSFDAVNDNKNAKVKVEFNYKNDRLIMISIYDNGVGMDWDDITNYYLKVGNSSKKAGSIGYIGQFGIGGLSL